MSNIISVFDAETTGVSTSKDQIVSFCITNYNLDTGARDVFFRRCKPSIPIPENASKVHGITDKDVENEPPFSFYAPKVLEMIEGNVLGGQNIIRFDIPLLYYELKRAGIDWKPNLNRVIDTYVVYSEMFPRTLEGIKKFYTGKDIEDAHDAAGDVSTVIDIIPAMMGRHGFNTVDQIIAVSTRHVDKIVDFENKLYRDQSGNIRFSFGKYKDYTVQDVIEKEKGYGYFDWLSKPTGANMEGTTTMDILNSFRK